MEGDKNNQAAGSEQSELEKLKAELAEKEAKLAEKDAVIDTLTSVAKSATKGQTVTIGKKEHTAKYPTINHEGKVYTAAEVVANKELAKELLDLDCGFFE